MTVVTERQVLDEKRRGHGLSLAAVARETGIGYQRLWRYFTFEKSLNEDELVLLSEYFDSKDAGVTAVENAEVVGG